MRVKTIRKIHRSLGFVIGIQLLLWSAGGVVFSWNDLRKVRGEDLMSAPELINLDTDSLVPMDKVWDHAEAESVVGRIQQITLRSMAGQPIYELTVDERRKPRWILLDAYSGKELSPISKEQATAIANTDFSVAADVRSVERIESVGAHSEYRGKELPAYRVALEHETDTVIYVSANRGAVTARRNNRWRLFDFFWMLHTMDYQSRDNFNGLPLRLFSVFGAVTVLSGFVLGIATSSWFRAGRRRRKIKPGR